MFIRSFSTRSVLRVTNSTTSVSLPTKIPVHLEYDLHLPKSLASSHQSPIILLHGLFGSKQNYLSVAKKICQKLNSPVYALDLRNHGDSPHVKPFDYLTMAEDVNFFIEEQNLGDNVTIVGHSMGAKVAMCQALKYPDKIKRLVSVDNSPVSQPLGLNFFKDLEGMYKLETCEQVLKNDKKWRDKGLKVLSEFEPNPKVRLFLIANYINKVTKFNYGNYLGKDDYCHFKIPVEYLYLDKGIDKIGSFPIEELKKSKFTNSTLFLKARNSNFINEQTIPQIYHYFPRASLKSFDTGHWLISEKPDKFIETLVSFIKST